jgi:prepilin-type N-terminal cleavage/methylation domain-containing protein
MRHSTRAYTLIEVLAVIAILAILATLFFPVVQRMMPRVERVQCANKLRNLHAVFAGYASEGWPQLPAGVALGSMAEQKWWAEKTKTDHGLSVKDWQCPTISREMKNLPVRERPLIHYLPTPFSGEPNRANRANKSTLMPWVIEIGNAHGQGNLILRQDGSIKGSRE